MILNEEKVSLDPKQKEAFDGYLAAESMLMGEIHDAVVEINKILKGIAARNSGEESSTNLKTYMSKEDYKTFLGMDDKMIKMWEVYCKDIINEPDLVENMPSKSFLQRK